MRRLNRDCFQLAAEGKGAAEVHETSRERHAVAEVVRLQTPIQYDLARG